MLLFKLACFLEILLYLMMIGTVIFVIAGVVYGTLEIRDCKATDPILYDDDNRAADFLAEASLEWNNV